MCKSLTLPYQHVCDYQRVTSLRVQKEDAYKPLENHRVFGHALTSRAWSMNEFPFEKYHFQSFFFPFDSNWVFFLK